MGSSVRQAIERVVVAHESLAATAEAIDDESQYVADLGLAWRARLRAVADTRDRALEPGTEAAIDRAIDEASRVTDPHRAIDWLSTLPQVVLLALEEPG